MGGSAIVCSLVVVAPIVSDPVLQYFVSFLVLQSSRCGRKSWLLNVCCALIGMSLLSCCYSSSGCHGLVCSMLFGHFLVIPTYFLLYMYLFSEEIDTMENDDLKNNGPKPSVGNERGVESTTNSKARLDIEPTTTEFRMTKGQIIKNILVLSAAFLFLFTAFQSLSNLQSSLNREEGLGTVGLAVVYGALVISCMFLPSFVINHLGCKWTVAFSMLCYILYMAANFYATWGTILPGAIILGLGAAPLWSAKCTYLTETGSWYARMTGTTSDDIINRFFGIFFMIFQTSMCIIALLHQKRCGMLLTPCFNRHKKAIHVLSHCSYLQTDLSCLSCQFVVG